MPKRSKSEMDRRVQQQIDDMNRALRGLILDSGRTQADLESALGWGKRTLSRRLSGNVEWTTRHSLELLFELGRSQGELSRRMEIVEEVRREYGTGRATGDE